MVFPFKVIQALWFFPLSHIRALWFPLQGMYIHFRFSFHVCTYVWFPLQGMYMNFGSPLRYVYALWFPFKVYTFALVSPLRYLHSLWFPLLRFVQSSALNPSLFIFSTAWLNLLVWLHLFQRSSTVPNRSSHRACVCVVLVGL